MLEIVRQFLNSEVLTIVVDLSYHICDVVKLCICGLRVLKEEATPVEKMTSAAID